MVGIFSRLYGGRSGGHHGRTESAVAVTETLAPHTDTGGSTIDAASHGVEVAAEFKPVEHPIEPFNHDQPVRCPLPEPSILNDGRIWKERMSSANSKMRSNLNMMTEGSNLKSKNGGTCLQAVPPRRVMLPSLSAPEHKMKALLEDCETVEN